MQFLLALLFVTSSQASFNQPACQALQKELTIDCMSHGCSGLLTTGTGASIKVRDEQECRSECESMSMMSTRNDEICIPPIPPAKPDHIKKIQDQNSKSANTAISQSDSQNSAISRTDEAEEAVKAKRADAKAATDYSQKLQEKKIQSSGELLRKWDNELRTGKSQAFPPDRAKWKNDQALVQEAERARQKNKEFTAEKADQAEIPAIRGNLHQFARARQLESESAKQLSALAITLAQLMQMKAKGQANLAALDQTIRRSVRSATCAEEPRRAQGAVSSALKAGAKIGNSPLLNETVQSESADSPKADQDAIAASGSASGPETSRANLKARLRELLRKKMAANGLSDMPEEFLGELGMPLDDSPGEVSSDQAASLAAEEEEIFRLAGADTDAEVQRLRSELQEELARSEGVLPSDSLSLFERVKAAHDSCAAKKCVGLDGTQVAMYLPSRQ